MLNINRTSYQLSNNCKRVYLLTSVIFGEERGENVSINYAIIITIW